MEDDLDSAHTDRSESEAEDGVQDWGTSKADYYDADIIETEADALEEEAEARRLQQKQLQSMTEADFGFDDSEWAQVDTEQDAGHGTVIEKLPDVAITETTPVVERLKILKSRYPELEPLAKDYTELHSVLEELKMAAHSDLTSTKQPSKKRKADQDEPVAPVSVALLKWRALSTYLGSIAMYFAILTAPASGKPEANAPMPPAELRQHPVMQNLLRSRQSWDTAKDLNLPETQGAEEESDAFPQEMPTTSFPAKITRDGSKPARDTAKPDKKSKKPKKSRNDVEEFSSKKRQTRRQAEEPNVLTELDNLIANVKKPSTTMHPLSQDEDEEDPPSDFGDELPLTATEELQKAHRKKGLRFYTSQLAQKSNKRGAASRDAGGDADLPYKERLKDRQARLMREAERRGGEMAKRKERLDYAAGDDEEEEIAREVRGDDQNANDGEEYYQTISSKSHAKKTEKAARAAAHAEAAKEGRVFIEDIAADSSGKRAITYEISKNKGLMPRRKKEVRNPRVKKRMKYDEKMKKLGSMRQVYKGGEGKSGYAGELTGIKTNVVRSVKL